VLAVRYLIGVFLALTASAVVLFVGPSHYENCRTTTPWDGLARWASASLGAGETDGPSGAPAYCELPTDVTWLLAGFTFITVLTVLTVAARRRGRSLE
jgi:hypothetical protein